MGTLRALKPNNTRQLLFAVIIFSCDSIVLDFAGDDASGRPASQRDIKRFLFIIFCSFAFAAIIHIFLNRVRSR